MLVGQGKAVDAGKYPGRCSGSRHDTYYAFSALMSPLQYYTQIHLVLTLNPHAFTPTPTFWRRWQLRGGVVTGGVGAALEADAEVAQIKFLSRRGYGAHQSFLR